MPALWSFEVRDSRLGRAGTNHLETLGTWTSGIRSGIGKEGAEKTCSTSGPAPRTLCAKSCCLLKSDKVCNAIEVPINVFETATLDAAVPRKLQAFKRQRSKACLLGIHNRTGSSSDSDTPGHTRGASRQPDFWAIRTCSLKHVKP